MALHIGMRQGEILGLPWRNIDYRNKCIMITQTLEHYTKGIKQGAKSLSGVCSIGISDGVIEVLQKHGEKINEEKELRRIP